MKYKVNDRVRIKSLDWYNENMKKESSGYIDCGNIMFTPRMSKWCGKTVTIIDIENDCYIDENDWYWTDEMIEGLVEEESLTPPLKHPEDSALAMLFHKTLILPEGYQFKDENGNVIDATKIVLEKKKKEYPKTFEECVHVLEGENRVSLELMNTFRKLIDARNAYWKIAGDWSPEFRFGKKKYCIMTKDNKVINATVEETNRIFVFPTEEMRDAFYENFKDLIEQCKELL